MKTHLCSSRSVVLITSKGKLVTRGPWTKVLQTIGVDQSVKLKGNNIHKITDVKDGNTDITVHNNVFDTWMSECHFFRYQKIFRHKNIEVASANKNELYSKLWSCPIIYTILH